MAFVTDYENWKRGRPQWAELVAGIRNEVDMVKLRQLAELAGASANELSDLRTAHNRARLDQHVARRFGADTKRLRSLDREIEQLEKARERATGDEKDDLLAQLQQAVAMRDRFFRGSYLASKVAADYHRVAETMGVI